MKSLAEIKDVNGVIYLKASRDMEGYSNNYNTPQKIIIKKGDILRIEKDKSATRRGDLFFNLNEHGENVLKRTMVHPKCIKTTSPYCTGFYDPKDFHILDHKPDFKEKRHHEYDDLEMSM